MLITKHVYSFIDVFPKVAIFRHNTNVYPTGSHKRGALEVGNIPVVILLSRYANERP